MSPGGSKKSLSGHNLGLSRAVREGTTERSNWLSSFSQSPVTVERNPVGSVFPIFGYWLNCFATQTKSDIGQNLLRPLDI
jgi:hypothetical protein